MQNEPKNQDCIVCATRLRLNAETKKTHILQMFKQFFVFNCIFTDRVPRPSADVDFRLRDLYAEDVQSVRYGGRSKANVFEAYKASFICFSP